MKKLAILISNAGTGTNLQAIIDAIESKKLNAQIELVVSDSLDAYGLERATKHDISILVYNSTPTRKNVHGNGLDKILKEKKIDYVCLAGWKQIISDSFIKEFKDRILNVHPGLIPDDKLGIVKNPDETNGLWNQRMFTTKAIQNFLDSKASYAGSSVHFLSGEFDFGLVLTRCFVKIKPNDTVESLYQRLKQKENEIYVEALVKLCNS